MVQLYDLIVVVLMGSPPGGSVGNSILFLNAENLQLNGHRQSGYNNRLLITLANV